MQHCLGKESAWGAGGGVDWGDATILDGGGGGGAAAGGAGGAWRAVWGVGGFLAGTGGAW